MKIRLGSVEGNVNLVATNGEVLHVEWLMNIANEVDDKFQGLLLFNNTDRLLDRTARIVRNGRDNAAFLWAVPLVVDIA